METGQAGWEATCEGLRLSFVQGKACATQAPPGEEERREDSPSSSLIRVGLGIEAGELLVITR